MSGDILNKDDIDLLLAGFPDLQQQKDFPTAPDSKSVTDYISNCMSSLGVEGRPAEMLEYLADVISMKMAAEASLGYPKGQARQALERQTTSTAQEAVNGLGEIAKGKEASIMSIHPQLRKSIASMDFKTAAAMYPVQSFLRRGLTEERIFADFDIENTQEFSRYCAISMMGGNETSARDLEPGEFSKTAGYRVSAALRDGLLNNFARMHLMTNGLQVRATMTLADDCPRLKAALKQDEGFVASHAAEVLAVLHAAREGGCAIDSFDTLKKMAQAPETKAVAYEYVPFHKVYARGVDVENQRTPFSYSSVHDSQTTDSMDLPRHLSEVKGGQEFVSAIKHLAYRNNKVNTKHEERA
jgi:hypothetical protein